MFQGQYFAGANQPYPFIPIPLTPGPHSQPPSSDDLSNTTSPPEGYADFPADQNFGHVDFTQFNHQHQTFAGPPTPPNQPIVGQAAQQHFVNSHLKQAEIAPQPQTKIEPGGADDQQGNARGHSNSEEDELTPAQSRRKAQNRAAQRAFRERKERHVKELELALASLKESQQETATENERLRRELQKMSTENEILRATKELQGANGSLSPEPTVTGPMQYNPTDFYSNVLQNHTNKTPSHRIVTSDDGERLLAAGATWDFIISHELYKRGLVDVGDVSDRLKHQARCDGQGPVFSERSILEAIKSSVASGSDELL